MIPTANPFGINAHNEGREKTVFPNRAGFGSHMSILKSFPQKFSVVLYSRVNFVNNLTKIVLNYF